MTETRFLDGVGKILGRGLRLWLAGWLLTGMGTHPLIAATFYVDPLLGDDERTAFEAIHAETPWKTLSHAMAHEAIGAGDVIRLSAGTYNDDTGETFPITPKDGVSLIGDGAEFTQLYSYNDVLFDVDNNSLGSATLYADFGLDADGYNAFRFAPDNTTILAHFSDLAFSDGIRTAFSVDVEAGGDTVFSPLIEHSTFSVQNNVLYFSASASFNAKAPEGDGELDNGTIFIPATEILSNPTLSHNQIIQSDYSGERISSTGFSGTALYFYTYGSVHGEISPVIEHNQINGGQSFLEVETYSRNMLGDLEVSPVIKSNSISGLSDNALYFSFSADMDEAVRTVVFSPLITNNTFSDIDGNGLELYSVTLSPGNFESHAVIAGNTFSNVGYNYDAAIDASFYYVVGNIDVDWQVLNNTISGSGNNYGISLSFEYLSSAVGDIKANISGNTITNGTEGIYVYASYFSSNNVGIDVQISGNTITGMNSEAISVSLNSVSSARDANVRITDNHLSDNDYGLYLYTGEMPNPVVVEGNTFLNSDTGVYLETWADLGGGEGGSRGYNTFLGNNINVENEASLEVAAHNNYWGLTEPTLIDETNFDDEEQYGGNVDVTSPLTARPTVSATASYNATLKTDPGSNGASEGDTLHYTLTITGTGQAGCGEAAVLAQIPSNATWVSSSESTSKGVFHNEGDHIMVALGSIAASETITVEWDLTLGEGCADVAVETVVSCRELGALPLAGNGALYAIGEKSFWPDADGDDFGSTTGLLKACSQPEGYVSNKGDCDDSSIDVNPEASEVCDGIDQDCDGNIDNGIETSPYYADTDDDGYGTAGVFQFNCAQPEGFVVNSSDCDDLNNQINPEQTEICDDQDNNCNEQTDEGVGITWYQDSDDDGYGDPEDSFVGCTAPEDFVSNDFDCNDDDDAAFTDAAEICDGVDNDCDGKTDDVGDTIFYADADDDGFGTKEDAVISCNRPSGTVTNSDDCNDDNDAINPDANEVCDSKDNDCNGLIDEDLENLYFADEDGDGFGSASEPLSACTAPEGYVSNSDDCRDTVAAINPNATEVCDEQDNNCDGKVDDVDGCVTGVSPSPTPDIDVTGGAGCSCDTRNSEAPAPVGGAVGLAFAALLLLRRRR